MREARTHARIQAAGHKRRHRRNEDRRVLIIRMNHDDDIGVSAALRHPLPNNRRLEFDLRIDKGGMVGAYRNHNYYGFHKHISLRSQKDRSPNYRPYLSLLSFVLRGIGLPECSRNSL